MGTSTLLFEDGSTQILIDGFFSRPSLVRAAIGAVRPNCRRIQAGLKNAGIQSAKLRAVFVAHAHIDHVLDAPEIAWLTGADLIGSPSVALVAEGHGLPQRQIKSVRGSTTAEYDAFKVTLIETPHSTPNVARGRIKKPVPRLAWAQRYRAKSSHAYLIEHRGVRFLVYPSTAYRPGLLKGFQADVVFLGMSGLGRKRADFVNAYWAETVGAVDGKLVYPIHWDHLGRPLDKPLRPMPWPFDNIGRGRMHLARLACNYRVQLRDLPLNTPVHFEPLPHAEPEIIPCGAGN